MLTNLLVQISGSELAVFLLLIALTLGFGELGFRLGLRLHVAKDEARKGQIGAIQAAFLGLLGLLLGFTFAMGVERYETRRGLIVQEANAVKTTYLRASLLPEAHQAPVKDLLRRYVDVRLKYGPLVDDAAKLAEGMQLTGEIQTELWKHATDAAKEAPNDITATFIDSLNEIIATDTERIAAMRSGIPGGVWFLLVIVAVFGCVTTSYAAGAEGARSKLGSLFLPLLISVVIVLVFDISHSRMGIIQLKQQPLVDLQQSFNR